MRRTLTSWSCQVPARRGTLKHRVLRRGTPGSKPLRVRSWPACSCVRAAKTRQGSLCTWYTRFTPNTLIPRATVAQRSVSMSGWSLSCRLHQEGHSIRSPWWHPQRETAKRTNRLFLIKTVDKGLTVFVESLTEINLAQLIFFCLF